MNENEIIQQTKKPYTKKILKDDLKALGIHKGDNVIVHSSLSHLGWIIGAERTIVTALIETIGEEGTIVMPCFSGDNSDPRNWQNPPVPQSWEKTIRQNLPPFEPHLTSTREMGRIVDFFRHYPKVLRSYHPQVSFCSLGPLTHSLLDNHQLSPGFGTNSPLQRMYDRNFKVLLLGVGYENCTCMHLGEVWSDKKQWKTTGSRIIKNNQDIWKEYQEINYDDSDFGEIGKAYEKLFEVNIGTIGQGQARLIPIKSISDFAYEWMKVNRK